MEEGEIERGKESTTTFTLNTTPLAAGTYILAVYGMPEEDPDAAPTGWARFAVD